VFWFGLVRFGGSPAFCREDSFIKTYVALPWHDAGCKTALEGKCKEKCEDLGLKYKKMYLLMGRRSALSIHNKLMLYEQILKLVWTYGIQLWRCTK
jgi:hypothetical protein